MIGLLSLVLACGEKPADTATEAVVECDLLTVDECGQRTDCSVITAREIQLSNSASCYTIADTTIDVGCQSIENECTEAEEFAQDPAMGECHWFNNGCLPTGWESCTLDLEEC